LPLQHKKKRKEERRKINNPKEKQHEREKHGRANK